MYAVIKTGGKQYRVRPGERIDVERLAGDDDASLEFRPLLVVDGDRVSTSSADLDGASVKAKIVGESAGPKVTGFRYKNKSNQRKRWGHRQHYTTIEITAINGAEG